MDKTELILHIGISKTGTSAIQNFLWKNRKRLSTEYYILYPKTGIFSGGGIFAHYKISWFIYKPPEVKINISLSSDDIIKDILDEIDKDKPKKVIISSEAFMHLKDTDHLNNFYIEFQII